MDLKIRINNLLAGVRLTDWLLTLLTLALAIAAIFQWREMRSGGIDTHALANATKDQAIASQKLSEEATVQAKETEQLARSMDQQAKATVEIAKQALVQAHAAQALAVQTKRSGDIQIEQLANMSRPWIGISSEKPHGVFISPTNGGDQIKLGADIAYKNVGNAPATDVIVHIELFLAEKGRDYVSDALNLRSSWCSESFIEGSQNHQITSIALLPNEQSSLSLDIESPVSSSKYFQNGIQEKPWLIPILIGCVSYRYGTSTKRHMTSISYMVQRRDSSQRIVPINAGESVPENDVVLIPAPFGWTEID